MNIRQSSSVGPDLELGRLTQDRRDQGHDWDTIAADLAENASYLQRAAHAYLDHVATHARANQLDLF